MAKKIKRRKKRKLNRILKKNYKLLQSGSLNFLEECELLAKTQDIYEKLHPQAIELGKMEENSFKEKEERCEALKKASLVECRKYFPSYLNQIKTFIDSTENCVLNGDYKGIMNLYKRLLKMIYIIEKEVFDIVAFRYIIEVPVFADWFAEYALRALHEKAKEKRKELIRDANNKIYLPN